MSFILHIRDLVNNRYSDKPIYMVDAGSTLEGTPACKDRYLASPLTVAMNWKRKA
jgi:hypothetical protein